jgi:hypothetical protein
MILEIYIAFFILSVLFLAIGIKTESATFVYLSMAMFIFSSLVMANEGVDIVTGTQLIENELGTLTSNVYTVLTMENNYFVMTYVYLFLLLPTVGLLSSIYFANKHLRS